MDWIWYIIVILVCIFFINRYLKIFRLPLFIKLTERKKSWQLKIINHYRKKHGLGSLKAYYAIDHVARSHSKYMAKHSNCNHDGFKNRSVKVQRLTGSGYVGENCYKYPAYSYSKRIALKLVNGWMKSPGHRQNLMNPNYRKIGIGIVTKKGYVYATQIFSG
jgi:uncharacterized protein YkwD